MRREVFALLSLSLGIRQKWLVSFNTRSPSSRWSSPRYLVNKGAGWGRQVVLALWRRENSLASIENRTLISGPSNSPHGSSCSIPNNTASEHFRSKHLGTNQHHTLGKRLISYLNQEKWAAKWRSGSHLPSSGELGGPNVISDGIIENEVVLLHCARSKYFNDNLGRVPTFWL